MTKPTLSVMKLPQRGATLIETLVALLVLCIGLMGIATLQITSLRSSHGAHLRSQATALAYDIADRMRANRAAALAGSYNIAVGVAPAGTTLPALDLAAWKQSLATLLPSGDGAVQFNGNIVSITVQWTDRLGADQFVTQTQI